MWQADGPGNGDIKCRGIRPSDGTLTNTLTIAGTLADELAPDVTDPNRGEPPAGAGAG